MWTGPKKREQNWGELTFAKTFGTVIRDGKNWPIADRRVTSNDPETISGHILVPVAFSFLKQRISIYHLQKLNISLPSSFCPLQFYNQQCVVESGLTQGEGGLYLLPAKTKVIPFMLVPQPEDVGKQLQV